MDPLWALLVAAIVAALAAWLLTPTVRAYDEAGSVWVRMRAHVPCAALAGAGAAWLAGSTTELVAFAAAGVGCSLLVVVDLAERRLPDPLVLGTFAALVLPLTTAAAVQGEWGSLGRGLLAALALLLGYFVLALIAPSGLGLGDVKFAAVIGLFLGWFGWTHLAAGTLLGFILNGVVALIVVLMRRRGEGVDIPFGPSMVLGAALAAALLA